MRKRLIAIVCLAVLTAGVLIAATACGKKKEKGGELYTVTYEAGAADATGTAPKAQQYAEGETVVLSAANTFLREGYQFTAWNDGTKDYAAGESFTMPAHDVKFTAQWEGNAPDPVKMEKVDEIPTGYHTTQNGTAKANWFAEYGDDAFVITACVEDTAPFASASIYQNDSIRIYLAKFARLRGYSEGTINILADLAGNLRVTNAATGELISGTKITSETAILTLDGENAAGYRIKVSVPYSETEFTRADKDASVAFCLNNASNENDINTVYDTFFNTDRTRVHTYIVIPADNTFEENPYLDYGAVWGDAGNLRSSDSWNLENDTAVGGRIFLTSDDNMDNYVYMHGSDTASRKAYMEAEINVSRAFPIDGGYDQFPKFGIILSNASGSEKFFFFVDARSNGFTGDIEAGSTSLGTALQKNGNWDWNTETKAGDISGTSALYYPLGYLKLGVYREGNTVSLYANGVKKKTMKLDFGEDESVYFGLASFHLQLSVKNYLLETENFDGFDVAAQELDYLFLGASTLTDSDNYWYSYANQFKNEKAVNLSVPGYQVENWVNQLDSLQAMYTPKKIVMHIGMNNINNAGETGERVIERLEQLFGGLKDRYPEAELYYISIIRNVKYSENDSKYTTVNNWVKNTASGTYGVTFIDVDGKFTRTQGWGSTSAQWQWFAGDGFHLSSAGYGIFHREIMKAIGMPYEGSVSGLGDLNASGAPAYGHTGDWQVENGIWHGSYGRESRLPINGAYASGGLLSSTTLYAEAQISIVGVSGSYEKAGLALSSSKGTYFFYINLALETNNNGAAWTDHYAAVAYRPEQESKDWLYPEAPALFRPFGGNGYVNLGDDVRYDWNTNHDDYITLGVAISGKSIYLFANGKIAGSFTSEHFAANESVSISVFAFNTELYAKNGSVITNASQVNAKINGAAKVNMNAAFPIQGNEALPAKQD